MARWLPSCIALELILALSFPLRPVHAGEAKEVLATNEQRPHEEEIVNGYVVWDKERGLIRVTEEDSSNKVNFNKRADS